MPESKSLGVGATLTGLSIRAQFDINVKLYIGGNYATPTPAPLSHLNVFKFPIFGLSDYLGGYKIFRSRNREYRLITRYINGNSIYENSPVANVGDMVLVYDLLYGTYATVVISCKQVAYGTLLDSLESDRFRISSIRMNSAIPSRGFAENIEIVRQSLFGKMNNDSLSPMSFINPSQNQSTIADIPMMLTLDKELCIVGGISGAMGSELNFSMFVDQINKLK